jgi:hypothetical protein
MGSRTHGVGQAALEHAIDLAHLAPGGDFAVHRAQRGQYVLAQVPQRFEVTGKADALRNALDGMAAVNLQQGQHGGADLSELTIRRAAKTESGKGQKA